MGLFVQRVDTCAEAPERLRSQKIILMSLDFYLNLNRNGDLLRTGPDGPDVAR